MLAGYQVSHVFQLEDVNTSHRINRIQQYRWKPKFYHSVRSGLVPSYRN